MAFYYYNNPYSDILRARRDLQRATEAAWDGDNAFFTLTSSPKVSKKSEKQQGKEKSTEPASSSSAGQQLANTENTENNGLSQFFAGFEGLWRPIVDVKETEKELIIHAELPGVSKEDISIDVHDGVLSLTGEKKHTHKEEGEKYHRIERSYGKFSRSFKLPKGVDPSSINASFNDGVLVLTVPRPKIEEPPKHKITIQ
eukprot:TRINITY_DN6262_c0_g1_i2.p1 TRINITY_DN6262_c0_g1~~TRINITY_DN6262_c0_g1_i2.p1  ORF type:complete len:199 (-),score=43.22 TRINITY_DN6262_c0_g1_i2:98-694(-)